MFHALDNSAKPSEALKYASFQALRDSRSGEDHKKVTSMLSPPPSWLMLQPRSSRVTLDLLFIMEELVTTIRILGIEFQPCLPPPGPVRILAVVLWPYLPPPGPLLELGALYPMQTWSHNPHNWPTLFREGNNSNGRARFEFRVLGHFVSRVFNGVCLRLNWVFTFCLFVNLCFTRPREFGPSQFNVVVGRGWSGSWS